MQQVTLATTAEKRSVNSPKPHSSSKKVCYNFKKYYYHNYNNYNIILFFQRSIPPYTREMKKTVLGGKWLADEHITLSQAIQFPILKDFSHHCYVKNMPLFQSEMPQQCKYTTSMGIIGAHHVPVIKVCLCLIVIFLVDHSQHPLHINLL